MKIGILGYGTVASGLVDIIDNNKDKRDIKQCRNNLCKKYRREAIRSV